MNSEAKNKKAKLVQKKKAKILKDSQSQQAKISTFSVKRGKMDPMKDKKMKEQLVKTTILMNRPFSDIENPHFRKLLHLAEPNFLCPSRKKLTQMFDAAAVNVKESLKKEIVKDVTESGHKTISVVSDHGTSGDRFRTKKNAVVVLRTTKDFVIKKDVVKMLTCEESQTGNRIKQEVKEALIEYAGYEEEWIVNWKTDGEAKQLNASDPSKNTDVYMKINHRGKCVDHTFELASEESIKQIPEMKTALSKSHNLVNFLKDSSLAKTEFKNIMIRLGITPLSLIKGTDNRWFHKAAEAHRALELKEVIDVFFDEYNIPESLHKLEENDWNMLLIYDQAMEVIVEAAKILEGELYPTASSVVPFLDNIVEQLSSLKTKIKSRAGQLYVETLLRNLQSERRFPSGYKNKSPYNSLCLLDLRYADLYFDDEQVAKATEDIIRDVIFDGRDDCFEETVSPTITLEEASNDDMFARRRAELLAKKSRNLNRTVTVDASSWKGKIKEEIAKLLKLRGSLNMSENPMIWWKNNHESFPLLGLYWGAHSSFPATSTSAERSFNMDGLILTPNRYISSKSNN